MLSLPCTALGILFSRRLSPVGGRGRFARQKSPPRGISPFPSSTRMRRMIYVANARIPTEKAHGFQICKMCETFAELGWDVTLLHSYRRQPAPLQNQDAFIYYGVRPIFSIRTLANWHLVPLSSWIPERVFSVVYLAHSLLWGLAASLKARREAADIYYTRDSALAFWLLALKLPTVLESHVPPRSVNAWLLRLMSASPNLKGIVALTSFIKGRFEQLGFEQKKIAVCPDAVDLNSFKSLPGTSECRKRTGLPGERFIVGYVGRFQTLGMEKGLAQLIEAAAMLRLEGQDKLFLLCLGGPAETIQGYVRLAKEHGLSESDFRFRDRVHPRCVPWWIKSCDVVTIPWPRTEFSAFFTSPLKMFEYMAAERPILASNLPSIREVLQHGRNAWLIKAGSVKAIKDGVRYLCKNPEEASALALQASRDVVNYQWNSRAEKIVQRFCSS